MMYNAISSQADIGSWAYVKQVRIVTRTPGLGVKVEASMDLKSWTLADKVRMYTFVWLCIYKRALGVYVLYLPES